MTQGRTTRRSLFKWLGGALVATAVAVTGKKATKPSYMARNMAANLRSTSGTLNWHTYTRKELDAGLRKPEMALGRHTDAGLTVFGTQWTRRGEVTRWCNPGGQTS